jgi:hydrogenase large subunit
MSNGTENRLGCSTDRWLSLKNVDDFNSWLDESESHQNSGVGLITRFGRSIGLQKLGKGASNLFGAGCYYDPENGSLHDKRNVLIPGGFYDAETNEPSPFSRLEITEHVRHSWFMDYGGGRHPWEGKRYLTINPTATDIRLPRLRDTGEGCPIGSASRIRDRGGPAYRAFFKAEGPNTGFGSSCDRIVPLPFFGKCGNTLRISLKI